MQAEAYRTVHLLSATSQPYSPGSSDGALTGHGVGPSEMQSWRHSLLNMAKVLGDDEIPDDAGMAIECQLPQSFKRIEFVITGEDATARTKVIIVELKQWSEFRRIEKDAIVLLARLHRGGAGRRDDVAASSLRTNVSSADTSLCGPPYTPHQYRRLGPVETRDCCGSLP